MLRRRAPFLIACLVLVLCAAVALLAGHGSTPPPPVPGGVMVTAVRQDPNTRRQTDETGSGWVYDSAHGLVVTAYHVIDGSAYVTVGQPGEAHHAAQVIAGSPCDDVALL